MKLLINANTEKVYTDSEYMELLKREAIEYDKTVQELMETDTDFREYEINLSVGEELTLLQASEGLRNDLETTEDIFQDNDLDTILEGENFSYHITLENSITVFFEKIGEKNGLDTEIKITEIVLN